MLALRRVPRKRRLYPNTHARASTNARARRLTHAKTRARVQCAWGPLTEYSPLRRLRMGSRSHACPVGAKFVFIADAHLETKCQLQRALNADATCQRNATCRCNMPMQHADAMPTQHANASCQCHVPMPHANASCQCNTPCAVRAFDDRCWRRQQLQAWAEQGESLGTSRGTPPCRAGFCLRILPRRPRRGI